MIKNNTGSFCRVGVAVVVLFCGLNYWKCVKSGKQ